MRRPLSRPTRSRRRVRQKPPDEPDRRHLHRHTEPVVFTVPAQHEPAVLSLEAEVARQLLARGILRVTAVARQPLRSQQRHRCHEPPPAALRIVLGGQLRDRLRPWPGVTLQRTQRRVAALGHQQRHPNIGLGHVRDRRVAQLMQRPPTRRRAEQLLRGVWGRSEQELALSGRRQSSLSSASIAACRSAAEGRL